MTTGRVTRCRSLNNGLWFRDKSRGIGRDNAIVQAQLNNRIDQLLRRPLSAELVQQGANFAGSPKPRYGWFAPRFDKVLSRVVVYNLVAVTLALERYIHRLTIAIATGNRQLLPAKRIR